MKLTRLATFCLAGILLILGGWGSNLVRAGDATCRDAQLVITEAETEITEIADFLASARFAGPIPNHYFVAVIHHKGMIADALARYGAAGCDWNALALNRDTLTQQW